MKFKTNIKVDIHDVDFNGVARLSSLMRYIQSCAENQLTEGGKSYSKLRDMNRAFVLSKIKMEFTEPIFANRRLVATSYPCESHGFSFLRCYTLESEEDIIGKAVSVWALIDTNTKSLVKVNNFELGLTTYEPLDLSITRFSVPKQLKLVGTYRVNYDDTDQNMHMNNTRYPDLYSNFLDLNGKRIRTISINFLSEAPAGNLLKVYCAKADGGIYYFKTEREDGTPNTEAEIILEDIHAL